MVAENYVVSRGWHGVRLWGNGYRQLGLGDNEDRSTFTTVPLLPDSRSRCWWWLGATHDDSSRGWHGVRLWGKWIYNWAWAIMRIETPSAAVPLLPDGKVAKQVVAG